MPYDVIIGRNKEDKKSLGERGLINIGKGYVQMGQYTSLSNRILMDVAKSHVVLVSGKRGSGKSYTLGVLAEEISNLPEPINNNIASIIFDTMGIYWTMKYKNEKDKSLLSEWNLQSKELPVKIFSPFGYYKEYTEQGIPVDDKFALDPSELNAEDWIITFGLDLTNSVSVIIERTIIKLKEKGSFNISEIINSIKKDETTSQETKNAAIGLFESANTWGIFSSNIKESTKVSDLINPGKTTILDLSVFNSVGALNVRGLVINLISRKIFTKRMAERKAEEIKAVSSGLDYLSSSSMQEKRKHPMIWMFIDEAHEFLPLDKKTVATDALVQLLREGRQPGISLVLATQQPGQIHRDVMTQSDIVISHRVTNHHDLQALNYIMQSYVFKGLKKYMDELPGLKGSAIILDDNSERIYSLRMRPRFTWHGGEAPSAISKEKEL